MSQELLLTAYERNWNLRDPDACAGCFAPEAVREMRLRRAYRDAAPSRPTRGREAIRAEIALVMEAVPDLHVEVVAASYGSDRRLWTEWQVTGTCTGAADGGRSLDVIGVSIFGLSNAGFLHERIYWDSAFAR